MGFDREFYNLLKKYETINEYVRTPEEEASSSRSLGQLAGDIANTRIPFLPKLQTKEYYNDGRTVESERDIKVGDLAKIPSKLAEFGKDVYDQYVSSQDEDQAPEPTGAGAGDWWREKLVPRDSITKQDATAQFGSFTPPPYPDVDQSRRVYGQKEYTGPTNAEAERYNSSTQTEPEDQAPPTSTSTSAATPAPQTQTSTSSQAIPAPTSSPQQQDVIYGTNMDPELYKQMQQFKQSQSTSTSTQATPPTPATKTTTQPTPTTPPASNTSYTQQYMEPNKPKVMPFTATKS